MRPWRSPAFCSLAGRCCSLGPELYDSGRLLGAYRCSRRTVRERGYTKPYTSESDEAVGGFEPRLSPYDCRKYRNSDPVANPHLAYHYLHE